jgi:hypothetical protein
MSPLTNGELLTLQLPRACKKIQRHILLKDYGRGRDTFGLVNLAQWLMALQVASQLRIRADTEWSATTHEKIKMKAQGCAIRLRAAVPS